MSGDGGQVRRSGRAELDVIECAVFLARTSDEAAARFMAAVESTFEKLARSPLVGRRVERPALIGQGLRWWPIEGFPNHLIFYRQVEDGIHVVRVLHGARDWPTVLEDRDP
jgi:toxin ParE1/3/4